MHVKRWGWWSWTHVVKPHSQSRSLVQTLLCFLLRATIGCLLWKQYRFNFVALVLREISFFFLPIFLFSPPINKGHLTIKQKVGSFPYRPHSILDKCFFQTLPFFFFFFFFYNYYWKWIMINLPLNWIFLFYPLYLQNFKKIKYWLLCHQANI